MGTHKTDEAADDYRPPPTAPFEEKKNPNRYLYALLLAILVLLMGVAVVAVVALFASRGEASTTSQNRNEGNVPSMAPSLHTTETTGLTPFSPVPISTAPQPSLSPGGQTMVTSYAPTTPVQPSVSVEDAGDDNNGGMASSPSRSPTPRPSFRPSSRPTPRPSLRPSIRPTPRPSPQPTRAPTQAPTVKRTAQPSPRPTATVQTPVIWVERGETLTGSDYLERFGESCDVSSPGLRLVIGGMDYNDNTGRVKIFDFNESNQSWEVGGRGPYEISSPQAGSRFGMAVAISGDGGTIAASAQRYDSNGLTKNGAVFVYRPSSSGDGTWVAVDTPIVGTERVEQIGSEGLDLNYGGTRVAIGSPKLAGGKGSVYLYSVEKTSLSSHSELTPDDWSGINPTGCGSEVSFGLEPSDFGGIIQVLAVLCDEHVLIYEDQGSGSWLPRNHQDIHSTDSHVAINGLSLLVGEPHYQNDRGRARLFTWDASCSQRSCPTDMVEFFGDAVGDQFGSGVALNNREDVPNFGAWFAIGARQYINAETNGKGYVRAYDSNKEQLGQDIWGVRKGDVWGAPVKLSGNGHVLVSGAHGNDDIDRASGHARAFEVMIA